MKILLSILATALLLGVGAAIIWGVWAILRRSEEPLQLMARWAVSAVLVALMVASAGLGAFAPLAAAVFGIILGVIWAPHIATLLASPLTSAFEGSATMEVKPLYSIAEAKRKQGHFDEAIAEVKNQLSRFPGDFAGMILQAEIEAEDLKDPARAFETLEQILEGADRSPQQIAYTLNRAADWHLKLEMDPDLARARLERIVALCPESEQAQLALQRISHLASREFLKEQHDPRQIHMKEFQRDIGLQKTSALIKPAEEDPAVAAANCIKHLDQHPNDNEAREKLALIYANDFQRLDLASEQLEMLIDTPNQVPKQIVHWLNLLADLQIKLAGDAALARQTLERIVDRFPKMAAAENALSRMHFLNLELRKTKKSRVIKLGSYEQNIGLKSRSPSEDAGQSESQSR